MKIEEKILILRKQHNLSQEQLAERVGVSRQSISKWELGEATPDLNNIVRLSEVLNVSTDYLLRGASPEESKASQQTTEIRASIEVAAEDIGVRKRRKDRFSVDIWLLALVAFFLLGYFGHWHPGWLVFLVAIPLSSIKRGKFISIDIWVLATIAFFVLGYFGYWNPGWLVFLLAAAINIPVIRISTHGKRNKRG